MTERNANHIIPSYCYLPVSCRSLVDRCGSPGSCKPQIKILIKKIIIIIFPGTVELSYFPQNCKQNVVLDTIMVEGMARDPEVGGSNPSSSSDFSLDM